MRVQIYIRKVRKLMNKKKMVIIGAIVAAVVIVAVVLICIFAGNRKEDEEVVKNPYKGLGEIVEVKYTYNDETAELVKKKDKWSWKDDKDLSVDQEAIDFAISGIDQFLIVDFIEDAKDVDAYGLKKPNYSIALKDSKGKKKVINIGDSSGEDGMTWYVQEKGDSTIYVVGYEIIDCIDSLAIQRSRSIEIQQTGEDITEE